MNTTKYYKYRSR